MRKKLTAILLMCLCVLSLCGCASVGYTDYILSDGSIVQQIVVTLDESKIKSAGLTVDGVQTDIENYSRACYNEMFLKFNTEVTDADIKLYVLTNHKFDAVKKDNVLYIQIKFNNINAYYYFYNYELPEESDGSGVVTDNGFYQKDTTTTKTEFHDLANNNIAKYWLNYFASSMPNVSLSNCTYTYTYSTPYEKIYSDADRIEYDELGNVSHSWDFTADDLTGENAQTGDLINLYTVTIKSPLWYFVAIGATVVLVAVLYIVCAVKDNKKKKAKMTDGTQTNVEIK